MGFPKRLAGGLEMDAEHLEAAVNKIIRRRHPDVACQLTLTPSANCSLGRDAGRPAGLKFVGVAQRLVAMHDEPHWTVDGRRLSGQGR